MTARCAARPVRALGLAGLVASLLAVPAAAEQAERQAPSALKRQLVAVAASVLDLEAQLVDAEQALSRLEEGERAAARVLEARRRDLPRLLSALQRLARRPGIPFPAGSGGANDSLHRRILLEAVVPALERDARSLASNLRRLASLRSGIANRRGFRGAALRRLDEERRVLAALIELRSRQRSAGADADSPGGAARRIASIDELIDRLPPGDMAGLPPSDAAPGADPPQDLSRMPAVGRVTGRFGELAENGWTVRGITILTRASGQVVAPRSGRVVFAQPFLDYGELLIIDHGGGYHALLAGLARLDARIGDELVSGEPVGLMGSDAGAPHRLYIELRRGGRPVDPLPWLTEDGDKVGG